MISRKNKPLLARFGSHVKKIREQKGLSLRDLSYACNIDNSKISKIETGKVNITLLTVLELASATARARIISTGLLRRHVSPLSPDSCSFFTVTFVESALALMRTAGGCQMVPYFAGLRRNQPAA